MDWNDIAGDYSALDEARRRIVYPVVRRILAEANAQRVLDFGCGDGLFLEELSVALPLVEAVNFDPADSMYQLAASRSSGPVLRATQDLADVNPDSMDAVTSIGVWMCMHTDDACVEMLEQVRAVLRPGGHFVAAVTHPCFRSTRFSTYSTDFEDAQYLQSGVPFRVTMYDNARRVYCDDTHWTLGDLTRQLDATGFVVRRMHEPPDEPDNGVPPWLIVQAERLRT